MTTIGSQEDFLQALRDNPAWREAVRSQILGDELLQLPVRFHAFEKRFDAFEGRVETRFEEVDARFDRMDARFDRVDTRFDRMEGDMSELKRYFTESQVRRSGFGIAMALGQNYVRTLELEELGQLAQQGIRDNVPAVANRPAGDHASFARADLVIETEGEGGNQYVAVEISYTGAPRDVDRAERNARFLTALTGRPATAVVASVRNEWEVETAISAGRIRWYRITEEDL